jgi:hypothetical protein
MTNTTIADEVGNASPGFAVSKQKRRKWEIFGSEYQVLTGREGGRSVWDNLASFQRLLDYGILWAR